MSRYVPLWDLTLLSFQNYPFQEYQNPEPEYQDYQEDFANYETPVYDYPEVPSDTPQEQFYSQPPVNNPYSPQSPMPSSPPPFWALPLQTPPSNPLPQAQGTFAQAAQTQGFNSGPDPIQPQESTYNQTPASQGGTLNSQISQTVPLGGNNSTVPNYLQIPQAVTSTSVLPSGEQATPTSETPANFTITPFSADGGGPIYTGGINTNPIPTNSIGGAS